MRSAQCALIDTHGSVLDCRRRSSCGRNRHASYRKLDASGEDLTKGIHLLRSQPQGKKLPAQARGVELRRINVTQYMGLEDALAGQ